MQLFSMYLFYYLSLKMEKFVVFGKYCEDAIIKRGPFREQHLNRLKNLKDRDILVTLGPTKCTKYLFGIFQVNDQKQLIDLIEEDIYWKKGIWINYEIYPWVQAFYIELIILLVIYMFFLSKVY